MSTISKNLIALRKAKGMSQINLSRNSGVSISTIRRIEAGESFGIDVLLMIAEALDVQPARILSGAKSEEFEKGEKE